MEQRWALYLALAVVAGAPSQGRRIPRSTAISDAAEEGKFDSLQKGSESLGESTREKSYAGHSKGKSTVDAWFKNSFLVNEQPFIQTSWHPKSVSLAHQMSFRDGWTSEDTNFKEAAAAMDYDPLDLDLYDPSDLPERMQTETDCGDECEPNALSKTEGSNSDEEAERGGENDSLFSSNSNYATQGFIAGDGWSSNEILGETPPHTDVFVNERSSSKEFADAHVLQGPLGSEEEELQETRVKFQEYLDPNLSVPFHNFEYDAVNFNPSAWTFEKFHFDPIYNALETPERKFGEAPLLEDSISPTFHNADDKISEEPRKKTVNLEQGRKFEIEDGESPNSCQARPGEPQACNSLLEDSRYDNNREEVADEPVEEIESSVTALKRVSENDLKTRFSHSIAPQYDANAEHKLAENSNSNKRKMHSKRYSLHELMRLYERLERDLNIYLESNAAPQNKGTKSLNEDLRKIKQLGNLANEPLARMLDHELNENFKEPLKERIVSTDRVHKPFDINLPDEVSVLETSLESQRRREKLELLNEPELEVMAAYVKNSENARKSHGVREQLENIELHSNSMKDHFQCPRYQETRNPWNENFASKEYNKNSYPAYGFLKEFSKLCKAKDRFFGSKKDGKYRKDKFKGSEKSVSAGEQCDEESFTEQLLLSKFNETCSSPRGNTISKFMKARINSQLEDRLAELKPLVKLVIEMALHVSDHSNLDKAARTQKLLFYSGFLEAALKFDQSRPVSTNYSSAERFLEELVKTSGMEWLKSDLQSIGYDMNLSLSSSDQISGMMSVMVVFVEAIMLATIGNLRLGAVLIEEPTKSKKLIKSMLMDELFAQSLSHEFFAQISPGKLRYSSRPLEEVSVGKIQEYDKIELMGGKQNGNRFEIFSDSNGQKVWDETRRSSNEKISKEESSQMLRELEKLISRNIGQRPGILPYNNFASDSEPGNLQVETWARGDEMSSLKALSFGGFGGRELFPEEKCHNRDLMLCGKPALEKLQKEKDLKQRCRVREEFLTCMSKQRIKGCAGVADAQSPVPGKILDSPDISKLRNELRKSFHNCVLSYTIPDQL